MNPLADHYADNDGDLFITSNGYKSSLLGSSNIYPDHEYVNHNSTPEYTNQEYRKRLELRKYTFGAFLKKRLVSSPKS